MDTTAKVDIRRLQLLNDRIAQTIEALNQVRLSVHGLGLSHTAGNVQQGFGLGNNAQGFGLGAGLQGQGNPWQGGVPFGLQGLNPFQGLNQGYPQGIQHSSPLGYQQGNLGLQQGIPGYQQGIPGFQQGIPGYQQGIPGYQQGIPGYQQGLQHSHLGYQQGIPGFQQGIPGYQQGNQGFQQGVQQGLPYGYQQGIPGFPQGLQHTSQLGYQQGNQGFQQGLPFGQQGVGGWPVQNGVWGAPNLGGLNQLGGLNHLGGGLAHTSPDLLELQLQNRQHGIGLDPYTAARILQSFPFAQSAVPGLF